MAQIRIEKLVARTVVGVYQHERQRRQTLLLDLTLETDIEACAANDDIDLACDYSQVAGVAREFVGAHHFELIETYAQRLAELLVQRFGLTAVEVTVHKPSALTLAENVSVTCRVTSKT